jgi:hypothetical protein
MGEVDGLAVVGAGILASPSAMGEVDVGAARGTEKHEMGLGASGLRAREGERRMWDGKCCCLFFFETMKDQRWREVGPLGWSVRLARNIETDGRPHRSIIIDRNVNEGVQLA